MMSPASRQWVSVPQPLCGQACRPATASLSQSQGTLIPCQAPTGHSEPRPLCPFQAGRTTKPQSCPYQTPRRGSAAPVSGLLAWFHMWQSLHPGSSCSATAQTSRERGGTTSWAVLLQSGPKPAVRIKSDLQVYGAGRKPRSQTTVTKHAQSGPSHDIRSHRQL